MLFRSRVPYSMIDDQSFKLTPENISRFNQSAKFGNVQYPLPFPVNHNKQNNYEPSLTTISDRTLYSYSQYTGMSDNSFELGSQKSGASAQSQKSMISTTSSKMSRLDLNQLKLKDLLVLEKTLADRMQKVEQRVLKETQPQILLGLRDEMNELRFVYAQVRERLR